MHASQCGLCICMLSPKNDINSILITWTFFRATDVLPNRYLAWYTSLNWPRPIFFSIWKFASELWPMSGCNGFWKIWKQTALVRFGHDIDAVPEIREKNRTLTETEIWPLELKYIYKNWMIITILIPGLFLIMPQWPWTLIGRSCWVFAGVPVGSVTFKLTPSCELRCNHEDGMDRPAKVVMVRHLITSTLTLNHESSSVQPRVHEQHVLHNLVEEYTANIVLQLYDVDIQRQQTNNPTTFQI